MVQLMPFPSQNPIISCLIQIQTGFTFLVPAYPGCPGKEAAKRSVIVVSSNNKHPDHSIYLRSSVLRSSCSFLVHFLLKFEAGRQVDTMTSFELQSHATHRDGQVYRVISISVRAITVSFFTSQQLTLQNS